MDIGYETYARARLRELIEMAEAVYEDRIEIDLNGDPEPIDIVITSTEEAAMSLIVKEAIGTLLVGNRQREKVSRRSKGPGLGVPSQRFGIDSASTMLDMMNAKADAIKEAAEKGAKDRQKDIDTLKLWIKDAEKVKALSPNKYWDLTEEKVGATC
jgi:hypothetical protein